MAENIIRVESISQLHAGLGLPKPKHPLVSLFDVSKIFVPEEIVNTKIIYDFYTISLKDNSRGIEYGRNFYDFDEGVMVFAAPGQVYTPVATVKQGDMQGWSLFFHADLVRNTSLGNHMDDYSFFKYDAFEALHLSEDEENIINEAVLNIEKEYNQRIDNHSQRVIVSNLELLLNYCLRFYERQFNTRVSQNKDTITLFEKSLKEYFDSKKHLDSGLPTIGYFAENAHLSPNYFSDLIKKTTGRTPKDHIHDYVLEKAKDLMLGTGKSISEIAYELGFNYPHYFTRLFKSKTGLTPLEYRSSN